MRLLRNNKGLAGLGMIFLWIGVGAGILKAVNVFTGGREIKKLERKLEDCEKGTHVDKYAAETRKCRDQNNDLKQRLKDNEIKHKDKVANVERKAKQKVKKCNDTRHKDWKKWKGDYKKLKKRKGCIKENPFEKVPEPKKQESAIAEEPDKEKEERRWWKLW